MVELWGWPSGSLMTLALLYFNIVNFLICFLYPFVFISFKTHQAPTVSVIIIFSDVACSVHPYVQKTTLREAWWVTTFSRRVLDDIFTIFVSHLLVQR